MANKTNPMNNVVFDGVKVIGDGKPSDYNYFRCDNVANGVVTGDTWPVPSCFSKKTEGDDEIITYICAPVDPKYSDIFEKHEVERELRTED